MVRLHGLTCSRAHAHSRTFERARIQCDICRVYVPIISLRTHSIHTCRMPNHTYLVNMITGSKPDVECFSSHNRKIAGKSRPCRTLSSSPAAAILSYLLQALNRNLCAMCVVYLRTYMNLTSQIVSNTRECISRSLLLFLCVDMCVPFWLDYRTIFPRWYAEREWKEKRTKSNVESKINNSMTHNRRSQRKILFFFISLVQPQSLSQCQCHTVVFVQNMYLLLLLLFFLWISMIFGEITYISFSTYSADDVCCDTDRPPN